MESNDGGLYKCVATSKVGTAEHSARLNVYGLPFIRSMDKVAVVAGEMMYVTCPVAGYPIESIQWEKGIICSNYHYTNLFDHTATSMSK